jgi:signal peptidase II
MRIGAGGIALLITQRIHGRPRYAVRWLTFGLIVCLGAAADLWTKDLMFGWLGLPLESSPYWIVENYIGFETTVNPGALFGLGAGWGLLFAAMSVVAAIGILVWLSKFNAISSWWMLTALAFVGGGIIGNLYDRLGLWNPPPSRPDWSSGVRDWILLRYGEYTWPNFNIADSLLVCGAIMLAAHSFFVTEQIEEPTSQSTALSPHQTKE